MESDEEDFVFYGTPIEREEDVNSRKKKAVAEASGQLRTLVPWKQEVRDEEGRRRFHGAFTGGYSAGYYNTVGSKEGWTPSTFTSSRKSRAEVKQQSIFNFLDEDEKAELEDLSLGTSMQFDTFGFTAAELARKQAEKEQQERPSAIPGPVPDEIVSPVTESVGVKLLLKMGWRRGRSIKESQTNVLYDARREARKSFLALASDDAKAQVAGSELVEEEIQNVTDLQTDSDNHFSKSTPVYVRNPKKDLHGLGYDPYKNAPEFREKKRSRSSGHSEMGHRKPLSLRDSLFGFKSGRVAPGFGTGALEGLDVEDEDVYGSGYDFETYEVEDTEETSRPTMGNVKMLDNKEHGVLPGFKAAKNSDYQLARFDPPVIPKDFILFHKFTAPLEAGNRFADVPQEVPPPEDSNLKLLIEGVASLVARCGTLFEDLSREKNQSNPLFDFLNGGNGREYYERRLWEEKQKRNDKTEKQLDSKLSQNAKKMSAESRGKILGEKPLERSSRDSSSLVTPADSVNLQFNLSDTFTKPASLSDLPEVAKPFLDDPAKQERFEKFLKEKYQGGLRAKDAGGASKMSEAARARERLEFEAAAQAIEKGKSGKESTHPSQLLTDVFASSGLQFTAGAVEHPKDSDDGLVLKKLYPKREEFQWRPSPLLCKRFDLIDPYMGKPPPAPRAKTKMESFLFVPDSTKAAKVDESVTAPRDLSALAELDREEKDMDSTDKEIDVKAQNVERPVDLYKAIFSDDSDEEEEITNTSQQDAPEKKVEAASTTLSRLIAGDFLESLGKELGMEVPPEMPYSASKTSTPAAQKDFVNATGEKGRLQVGNKSSTPDAFGGNSTSRELQVKHHHQKSGTSPDKTNDGNVYGSSNQNISKINETSDVKNDATRAPVKDPEEDRKSRPSKTGHRHLDSNSSEDERVRKRRRNHDRSISPDSDPSSSSYDYEDRHRSRSKRKRKDSSREKSSSRSHSKHHKHKRRDSPHRSRHSSEKDRREGKRERHKQKGLG